MQSSKTTYIRKQTWCTILALNKLETSSFSYPWCTILALNKHLCFRVSLHLSFPLSKLEKSVGMNTRVRTSLKAMKAPSLNPDKKKKKMEVDRSKLHGSDKETASRRRSSRERKMALLQDVDKLKKKLRHEENVHKALERAFTRPLGALPRLPPYLPPQTLELLAEVAVLEVEVVRLEDQVVNFRQDLYQEAVYTSTWRTSFDSTVNLAHNSSVRNSKQGLQISPNPKELNLPTTSGRNQPALCRSVSSRRLLPSNSFSDRTRQCSGRFTNVRADLTKILGSPSCLEDREGKENQSCVNSVKDKRSLDKTVSASVTPVKKSPIIKHQLVEKCVDPPKRQTECRVEDSETMQESSSSSSSFSDDRIRDDTSPNKISENLVQCLSSLLIEMSTSKENGDTELWDPYSIYREFRRKDIGLQKHMSAIEVTSIDLNKTKNTLFLFQRLKVLLEKLAAVKLEDLTHQQKLAFWINAYNSCMMNAFVEHGTPKSPDIVVALMQKATINVGGHFLNAITIEHFILRLPFHLKYTCPKSAKTDDIKARTMSRLEWSEPLVTFALSCGSWSSPAVRVYTASEVKNELEAAKRDYLQAAVGVSSNNKLMIPKLLDWYLLDFAKDLESLIDWICLQLADELRSEAMTCLAGRGREPTSKLIQLVPYDFRFRYILQR